MNNNQYIAHSAIVCHSGVKGMKWGKHIKSAGEWIDKNITGASARRDMDHATMKAGIAQRMADYSNENRQHYNIATRRDDASAKAFANNVKTINSKFDTNRSINEKAAENDRSIRNSNVYKKEAAYDRSHSAEAARAQQGYTNEANKYRAQAKSAEKRYNQSLAGKTVSAFGKAKTFFGKPTLSRVVKKNGKKK